MKELFFFLNYQKKRWILRDEWEFRSYIALRFKVGITILCIQQIALSFSTTSRERVYWQAPQATMKKNGEDKRNRRIYIRNLGREFGGTLSI